MSVKLERAAAAKIELVRKLAWNDFYFFTKFVCGRDLMEEQPHREVCEFLTAGLHTTKQLNLDFTPPMSTDFIKEQAQSLSKLLMLPRNSFKSTITTNAFPLWLLWHNQDLRIMIGSETLSNAKMYLAGIKDMIENNPMLKMVCTDEHGNYLLEPNKKIAGGFTEDQLILLHRKKLGLKEPSIFCSGVDNARTGMHPDVILGDDLVSERNVSTQDQIEKVKDYYKFSLSLLEPGGLLTIIGTRYHMADLYGELIKGDKFSKLIRPAILPDGELYFPTRLTHDFLDDLRKAQGSYIFSCQYMLTPIDDSQATFKKSHIQYFTKTPPLVAKYILIDLAIGQTTKSDYTVILTVGETAEKRLYVLEYDRGRYKPKEQIDRIFQMYERHRSLIKKVGIEVVAYQKAMYYLLQDEMKRRGIRMPLEELKADRDKKRRIGSLQPLFENGEVYILRSQEELEKELLEFPFSEHDDIVDALAYILQILKPGVKKKAKREYNYKPSSKVTNY